MYFCPSCKSEMTREQDAHGLYWVCGSCSHWLISNAVLRQKTDPAYLNALWLEAKALEVSDGPACPACSKPMKKVRREYPGNPLCFDICIDCEIIWLGPQERSALPPVLPLPRNENDLSKLPPEAAKTIALVEVERMAEAAGPYVPDPAWWEILISYLGFPTQLGGEKWNRFPWALLSVVLLCTAASLCSFHDGRMIQDWGFVPAEWSRSLGFTTLTSFFLHVNWSHLLGNMYFLLVFGLSIENRIGPWQFLVLLLLSHLTGDLGTYLYDPKAEWSGIGASGGIAGVMLFFAFAFPKRPILLWGLEIPAVVFMLVWLFFQWIYGSIQVYGWEDGIGYYAHLGGGLFGWVYWFGMRKRLDLDWKQKKSILET